MDSRALFSMSRERASAGDRGKREEGRTDDVSSLREERM